MSPARSACAAPWLALVAVLLAWLAAAPARAQRDLDAERFTPALDAEGFLGVQGTRTPGHLRTSFGAFAHYANSLLEGRLLDGSGPLLEEREVALVEHRATLALSVQLGLGPRAALAVTAPLVLYQTGEAPQLLSPGGPVSQDLPAFAVADPGLHARYRLLGDAAEDRRDGPGLGIQVGATAPIGTGDAYASEDEVRAYGQLLFDFHLLGLGVGTSAGVSHVFGDPDTGEDFTELTFGAALKVPIPPLHPLAGLLEVRGATDFKSEETTIIEGELGGLLGLGEWTLALAVGTGLHGAVASPDVRVIAGVWYTPKRSDTDGDGIPDDEDGCPPLPEDRDGHEDEDGCPDPDNDNDLVPDVDDLCPNQEALEGRDDNEDGCTD